MNLKDISMEFREIKPFDFEALRGRIILDVTVPSRGKNIYPSGPHHPTLAELPDYLKRDK